MRLGAPTPSREDEIMSLPDKSTPVARCLYMSLYTEQMLGKFADNPRLAALIPRLRAGSSALESAELAYIGEFRVLTRLRIDVDFENYLSDLRVRRTRKRVELHDGRRGGRIAAQILPDGSLDFSRIQGAKQIDAMRLLEARLAASQDIWPEAVSELADIAVCRVRYASALAARDEGVRRLKELRTARDAARERFVLLYAEIASLVAAEFPRDRVTQALFFLDARDRMGRPSQDGTGDEPPGEPPGEPSDELPGVPTAGA
jgi:hypothetical protein